MRLIAFIACTAVLACTVACGGSADNPDAKVCVPPVGFTFSAIGERSFASFGWTGSIHNVSVTDGTPFGVKVTSCDGCDGVCTFEGPTDPIGPVKRRRCLNRTSKLCQTDADCPVDGTPYNQCVYIYDVPNASPLAGAGGKLGACAWSYLDIAGSGMPPTVKGTIDQTSGEVNLSNLAVLLPFNGTGGTYRGSCSECIGDDIANDGVKNGTCRLGTRGENFDPSPDIGSPCDVHRFGNIPGYEGTYSMDCSPTVRASDGSPSIFGGVFNSGGYKIEITSSSPNCTDPAFAGQKCFCGVCPDTTTACLSNADCGGAQCGYLPSNCNPNPTPLDAAGNPNPGFNPSFAPHQCRGPDAMPSPSDPIQRQVTVGGNTCVGNACAWNPATGLGSCTSRLNGRTVGCYPTGLGASVVAPGRVDKIGGVYIVDTASARCNRLTPSAAVNGTIGLPGLTFQKRSFRITPEYPQ